jgi:hypothetical protein
MGIKKMQYLGITELEGEKCPEPLRKYVMIWVRYRLNGKEIDMEMHKNNRAGRHRVSNDMCSLMPMLNMPNQPVVESWILGALPTPDESGKFGEWMAEHAIPD